MDATEQACIQAMINVLQKWVDGHGSKRVRYTARHRAEDMELIAKFQNLLKTKNNAISCIQHDFSVVLMYSDWSRKDQCKHHRFICLN